MRIDYHPAVAAELEEIRDYYEKRCAGLGADFVDEFERQVLAIAAMPTRWRLVHRETRGSLMKRFPYVVCFRLIEGGIRVLVVKHEKRHPSYGLSRE
jgi:plasmid stabilization system protein ParE